MFSEPAINSVRNLLNIPGLSLELFGAAAIAFGVVSYLVRLTWISYALASRLEAETMQGIR